MKENLTNRRDSWEISYSRDGNAVPVVELMADYVSERLDMYLRVLER